MVWYTKYENAIFYKEEVLIPENLTNGDSVFIDGMELHIKSFSYNVKSTLFIMSVEDKHCSSKVFEDKGWKRFR